MLKMNWLLLVFTLLRLDIIMKVFLFKYDDDLTLVHKNQYHFNEKIIKTFKSPKEIKEKGFGLDKFLLTSFKMDAKGNHYLVAEHLGRKGQRNNNWQFYGNGDY